MFQSIVVQPIDTVMPQIHAELSPPKLIQHIAYFVRHIFQKRKISLRSGEYPILSRLETVAVADQLFQLRPSMGNQIELRINFLCNSLNCRQRLDQKHKIGRTLNPIATQQSEEFLQQSGHIERINGAPFEASHEAPGIPPKRPIELQRRFRTA